MPLPFRYWDKGLVATIGRATAVADLGKLHVAVILQWAWSYLTFKRGARLITDTAEQWRFLADRHAPVPPDAAGPDRCDGAAAASQQPGA